MHWFIRTKCDGIQRNIFSGEHLMPFGPFVKCTMLKYLLYTFSTVMFVLHGT